MSKWLFAFVLLFPVSQARAQSAGCPGVKVHFDTDSSEISAEDQALLNQAATCLKQNQRLTVSVEGRADKRGTEDYNQTLSEKRAEAVGTYLTAQGVSTAQMGTVGFGKDRPVCDSSDEDCLARNRQTAIRSTCRL